VCIVSFYSENKQTLIEEVEEEAMETQLGKKASISTSLNFSLYYIKIHYINNNNILLLYLNLIQSYKSDL